MAESKHQTGGKVGTDAKALHDFGGKGDFGTPVAPDIVREHEGEIVGRPGGSRPGEAAADHDRTVGVGSNGTHPGDGSGGDIDTDFVGVGGSALGGRAAFRESSPAETAGNPSGNFASGKPARGANAIPAHGHGTPPGAHGDSLDHSGESQYTAEGHAAGAVNPLHNDTPGAEGEITRDEATGDTSHGAE